MGIVSSASNLLPSCWLFFSSLIHHVYAQFCGVDARICNFVESAQQALPCETTFESGIVSVMCSESEVGTGYQIVIQSSDPQNGSIRTMIVSQSQNQQSVAVEGDRDHLAVAFPNGSNGITDSEVMYRDILHQSSKGITF